jgi:glyceraldehyde 3-phosphate dehydrogenase
MNADRSFFLSSREESAEVEGDIPRTKRGKLMAVRVGLMGFGRIGRNLFRILYKHDHIQIVAISDIADHKGLEYLLKYDTIMGRFPDTVSVTEGHL